MKVKVSLNRMLAFSVVAALLTVSIFAMPTATTYAQTTTEGGATAGTTDQGATTAGGTPLTFTLRTDGGGGAAGGGAAAAAPTTAGNDTTRNISMTVSIARGNEPPIQLPINATIPANTNSLDLCVSGMDIPETCQPVWGGNTTNATSAAGTGPTIDLTQNATGGGTAAAPTTATPTTPSSYAPTMTTTPSLVYAAETGISSSSSSSSVGRFIPVSGSLIGIEDTIVNIPVTVIAPITLQVQNSKMFASLLSLRN